MTTAKNPLHVCIFMGRYSFGGHAALTKEYVEMFRRNRFKVSLVAGVPEKGESILQHFEPAYMLRFYKRNIHPFFDLLLFFEFAFFLLKHRPDVVFTETAKAGFVGRFAAWLLRIPVIVQIFQGHSLRGYFSDNASGFLQKLERLAAFWCDKIIVPRVSDIPIFSDQMKIVSKEKIVVPRIPIECKPYPVDKSKARASWLKLIGKNEKNEKVIIIGTLTRLASIKRLDLALSIFAEAVSKRKDLHLVIAGDGPEEEALKKLCTELNLEPHVTFPGRVDDVPTFYGAIDILLHPSQFEGHGISTIEALFYKKIVVASDQGIIVDIPTQNKIIVPTHADKKDWEKALLDAASKIDQDQIENTKAISEYCQKFFSIKGAEEDMIRMIRDIATSKHQLRLLEKMSYEKA